MPVVNNIESELFALEMVELHLFPAIQVWNEPHVALWFPYFKKYYLVHQIATIQCADPR